jgi:DNA-binding NarL/FixJ family response regulator
MKILLVDDHALFRDGLHYMLQQLSDNLEILEAGNFTDGMRLALQNPEIDLALLDLNMPGSEGPASIGYFHQRCPHIPVVVISGEDSRSCMDQVLMNGAMGFINKSSTAEVMLNALKQVLSGNTYISSQPQNTLLDDTEATDRRFVPTNDYGLTPRQMQVLSYLAAGLSNKEIAEKINLAEGTVKSHVAGVFHVMGVNSRMEAVRLAERQGLISRHYG